jgi:hypothetical protein
MGMSIRLQVVLAEAEMAEIRRSAESQHLTVSAWVRQSLHTARLQLPSTGAGRKIDVIRAAAKYEFPTADIEVMLAETESGYHAGMPS